MGPGIKIEGVRELTRAIARTDKGLAKELGQRNKALGEKVIDAASPKPTSVGAGAGAMPRPSATRNVLRILAGGSWRKRVPVQQWGQKVVPRGAERPYIWQAGVQALPDFEREYVDALIDVARRAGLEAR